MALTAERFPVDLRFFFFTEVFLLFFFFTLIFPGFTAFTGVSANKSPRPPVFLAAPFIVRGATALTSPALLRPLAIPSVALLLYVSSAHFRFMASDILRRCSSFLLPSFGFLVAIFFIIFERNSGSAHLFFRVSLIRFRTERPTSPEATVLFVMSSRYSESSAHFRRRLSRIFCFVSSECLNPFRIAEGFLGFLLTAPFAYFSLRTFEIFRLVSSVGVYPPLAVFRARRSASFLLRSAFFRSWCSSSVIPSSASLARNRSRFRFRTPSAMRARVSSDLALPLFHAVLPLLAADILAFDSVVWVNPPLAVGRGTSRAVPASALGLPFTSSCWLKTFGAELLLMPSTPFTANLSLMPFRPLPTTAFPFKTLTWTAPIAWPFASDSTVVVIVSSMVDRQTVTPSLRDELRLFSIHQHRLLNPSMPHPFAPIVGGLLMGLRLRLHGVFLLWW
mmetsp:Transcript_8917/g.20745  ORF Transcript_8917/g.20745 Transcript_8917/m.20745 type:complete len:448 (-) Transcript_8917:378-1721(-)